MGHPRGCRLTWRTLTVAQMRVLRAEGSGVRDGETFADTGYLRAALEEAWAF